MLNGRKATKELLKELEQGTKPKTNADKIRAMTDPELAKRLSKLMDSYPAVCRELPECYEDLEADRDIPLERCEGCWIRWLRQPAEKE
jgi:hypothetical protein